MDNHQINEQLNHLLIDLNRSFLQYVGEAWPWTQVDADETRRTVDALVARQQRHVATLTDLLTRRGVAVDFGTYPTEYTDLHYVALDYLLSQLIAGERSLVTDIEQTLAAAGQDSDTPRLLNDILDDARGIVAQLQQLAASQQASRGD